MSSIPRSFLALAAPVILLTTACSHLGVPGGDSKPGPPAGKSSLASAVKKLRVKAPHEGGYERDKFKLWDAVGHDGCDTRKEVLISEAATKPRQGERCKLSGGRWTSYYDGKTVSRDRKLDIDHVVPLGEAWASGASSWSAAKRERYANDLGAKASLVAVSLGPNRSKGDRDPAQWMPPLKSAWCRYTTDWVDTKLRWGLTVDSKEEAKLSSLARSCPNSTVHYTPAR